MMMVRLCSMHPWKALLKLINVFWNEPLQDVDYEATMTTKLSIAKKIFVLEKDLILNSSSFQEYFSENEVSNFYVLVELLF